MSNNHVIPMEAFRIRSQVWGTTGMWAWLLHRVTGLGLVFYVLLHTFLMSLSLLMGQKAFDAALSVLMGNPIFEMLDILLVAAVLFHGFNGIRILLFDMGIGITVTCQRVVFWIFMAIAATLWLCAIAVKF
jgi:succinate dehydrogenase / fumarate reductase cytochrome b subunit